MDSLVAEAGRTELDDTIEDGFDVRQPTETAGAELEHLGMRDGMKKSPMRKVQTPVRFHLRELWQAPPQGTMEATRLLREFLLHEWLEIGPRFSQAKREQAEETATAFRRPRDQFEDGAEERYQNLLHRHGTVAGLGFKPVKQDQGALRSTASSPILIARMRASLVSK